ncbi:hypothetical protein BCR34DRAFT_313641 [Clohesyomyces aquaticus]|uniref:Uncharacterized protein n=1 Tax=Clohesyomyces aquaticus TaxID=1231657 RepID=A0A1Y1ZNW1_9PLEO|nr:hypothetical protein BCR34DRAFT_313641 [Clohesyomyces aquaticus]
MFDACEGATSKSEALNRGKRSCAKNCAPMCEASSAKSARMLSSAAGGILEMAFLARSDVVRDCVSSSTRVCEEALTLLLMKAQWLGHFGIPNRDIRGHQGVGCERHVCVPDSWQECCIESGRKSLLSCNGALRIICRGLRGRNGGFGNGWGSAFIQFCHTSRDAGMENQHIYTARAKSKKPLNADAVVSWLAFGAAS